MTVEKVPVCHTCDIHGQEIMSPYSNQPNNISPNQALMSCKQKKSSGHKKHVNKDHQLRKRHSQNIESIETEAPYSKTPMIGEENVPEVKPVG
jgi:hypothetical protein